jgi:dipeptidyl aminopeptidase/acylaminoacyl peptidase
MKLRIAGAMLLGLAPGPGLAAPDIAALAAAYGARPTARAMRMSPSGDRIVYFTPVGTQGLAVVAAEVATGTTKILLSSDKATATPYNCGWKGETRVICRVEYISEAAATKLSYRRAYSIAADGSARVMLGQRASDTAIAYDQAGAYVIDWLPDDPDHVLMQVNMVEQVTLGSNVASRGGGVTVQKVDVATGKMVQVERADPQVFGYDTDNQGQVRYMEIGDRAATGYRRDMISYMLRGKDSKDWRKASSGSLSGTSTWSFAGFDESGDNVFVVRPHEGRSALFRDPVDGGAGTLVFADPKVDVDGVLRIGKFLRPVAAAYTSEGTEYHYFDPVLERRAKALSGALPGKPPVEILDESWDGKRNLVFAGGVADPGQFYRYDTATKQLTPLLAVRPDLAGLATGPQTAMRYPAPDGAQVPAFLTTPAAPVAAGTKRPAIIMPHGGPAARDALGFDWLAQYYAQLGYLVLQPNFRGSTGYGEEWYAKNGFKSWEAAMADINAGARWLVAQGLADPARIAIFGWSYGGYAALQASAIEPGLYKAVVAVAPVTDLAQLKAESKDYSNYTVVANYIGDGPHVMAGSPSQNAARIAAPVLMFHGDKDLNVDIAQSRTMDAALTRAGKRHELIVYKGLDHQLDDSGARADMLKRSAEFIAAALK